MTYKIYVFTFKRLNYRNFESQLYWGFLNAYNIRIYSLKYFHQSSARSNQYFYPSYLGFHCIICLPLILIYLGKHSMLHLRTFLCNFKVQCYLQSLRMAATTYLAPVVTKFSLKLKMFFFMSS